MKKKFAPKIAHLFISLWSLCGKNLLLHTKLDLCTAVDNFLVIALVGTEQFNPSSVLLASLG